MTHGFAYKTFHHIIPSVNNEWEQAFADIAPPEYCLRRVIELVDLTVCLDRTGPSGDYTHSHTYTHKHIHVDLTVCLDRTGPSGDYTHTHSHTYTHKTHTRGPYRVLRQDWAFR